MAVFLGCVSTRYSQCSILEHNQETKRGKYVDKVWIDNSLLAGIKAGNLYLGKTSVDSIRDEKGITRKKCQNLLSQYFLESNQNTDIVSNPSDSGEFMIDLIFTNMSPGDAGSRIWAGEFGLGHANVEIQAIVVNKDGKRVIEISDSRNNSGAIGFRDTFGDSGPQLVEELIKEISDNILQELNVVIK